MRTALLLAALLTTGCVANPPACPAMGGWVSPVNLRAIADPLPALASRPVILLGETHDNAADHRWELATIARLYTAQPSLVLGFEMFPRRAQPVLNEWVAGRLTEDALFARSDWTAVWGFPRDLYAPIFRFARDHRIPMLALNVSHRLVHLAATKGWAGIPAADREGIADPAPPQAAYRASLASVMAEHGGPAMSQAGLAHFVDAQTVWDSAMAQAIAAQHASAPGRPVVAIMGEGHTEHRWGVPHQLDALGLRNSAVLLTLHDSCVPPGTDIADGLFMD